MDRAREQDLVMIAAAGNWGRDDKPAFPAAYKQVVAVTAVGSYHDIYQRANRGDYIDFAAPGVRMLTAAPGGGTAYQSGTSFATPFLTALIALEVANGAGRDPLRLKGIFTKATEDLGSPGKDKVFGYGFIEKQPHCRK
jgi:subtilisin family serine protease